MQNNDVIYDSRLLGIDRHNSIYNLAGTMGGVCIDAGAAAGMVTDKLLEAGADHVIAFEPFPGNFPHFDNRIKNNEKVTFIKKAVGDHDGVSSFFVANCVPKGANSHWGKLPGYSSLGYLTDVERTTDERSIEVGVVRLEDYLEQDITLLKMDLQGGELKALVGAGDKISKVKACFIEFNLEWDVIDFLLNEGFIVFDTMFVGSTKVPIEEMDSLVTEAHISLLSTGVDAINGYLCNTPRNLPDYKTFLEKMKKEYFHFLQTDLIAIRPEFLPSYIEAGLRCTSRRRA